MVASSSGRVSSYIRNVEVLEAMARCLASGVREREVTESPSCNACQLTAPARLQHMATDAFNSSEDISACQVREQNILVLA